MDLGVGPVHELPVHPDLAGPGKAIRRSFRSPLPSTSNYQFQLPKPAGDLGSWELELAVRLIVTRFSGKCPMSRGHCD